MANSIPVTADSREGSGSACRQVHEVSNVTSYCNICEMVDICKDGSIGPNGNRICITAYCGDQVVPSSEYFNPVFVAAKILPVVRFTASFEMYAQSEEVSFATGWVPGMTVKVESSSEI